MTRPARRPAMTTERASRHLVNSEHRRLRVDSPDARLVAGRLDLP